MDLGVLEGKTRGGYFLDSIFDPSVNQCSGDVLLCIRQGTQCVSVNNTEVIVPSGAADNFMFSHYF